MIEKEPTPEKKFTTHSPRETSSEIRLRSWLSLGEKYVFLRSTLYRHPNSLCTVSVRFSPPSHSSLRVRYCDSTGPTCLKTTLRYGAASSRRFVIRQFSLWSSLGNLRTAISPTMSTPFHRRASRRSSRIPLADFVSSFNSRRSKRFVETRMSQQVERESCRRSLSS